jgi:adenine-specific DNA-methyltransferase
VIPLTTETAVEVKARGGFYTPAAVTDFMAAWCIREPGDRALEPSCGDGAFIAASAERYAALGVIDLADRLYGVELEDGEAAKSRLLAPTAKIVTSSFFDVAKEDLPVIDAVIGNPPYIRYHGFTGENRRAGLARAKEQGVVLTQLTSSWAPFVVHAAAFMPETGGRLALVLPAELLHTDYAEPVREFLLRRFSSVVVVAFDRNVFEDAQVDAVLLLASDDDDAGMRMVRVHGPADLASLNLAPWDGEERRSRGRRWSATLNTDVEAVYAGLRASDRVRRLSTIASVDIGVVTGASKFFILTDEQVKAAGLPPEALTAIVQRPGDIPGLTVADGETRWLLDLPRTPAPTDPAVLAYIARGEAEGFNQGYKCRNRKPWYSVPVPKVRPGAFLPYMNHHAPRLIVDDSGIWSTNLIHGVAFRDPDTNIRAISAAMLSATTLLSSEIEGRAYGGGVLKLETKEAERLLVPTFDEAQQGRLIAAFDALDGLVRAGRLDEASALVDGILDLDHERFIVAFKTFRARRQERKLSPSAKPKKPKA